jgi:hypothetical protein
VDKKNKGYTISEAADSYNLYLIRNHSNFIIYEKTFSKLFFSFISFFAIAQTGQVQNAAIPKDAPVGRYGY